MTLDELDRLAAEKVMGWILQIQKEPFVKLIGWYRDGIIQYRADEQRVGDRLSDWWMPTRNIAQAWECVEALGELSEIKIGSNCTFFEGGKYFVDLYCKYIVSADTIPLAIVKAVLKAKGVEV